MHQPSGSKAAIQRFGQPTQLPSQRIPAGQRNIHATTLPPHLLERGNLGQQRAPLLLKAVGAALQPLLLDSQLRNFLQGEDKKILKFTW